MPPVKFSVHKKFHLLRSKTRTWESSQEHLVHYRVIFVLSGEGKFILNSEMHSYVAQGVIFVEPGKHPIFQEDNGTEVFVIAFDTHLADDFQKKKKFSPDFADTYKQVENLCKRTRVKQGQPISDERDAQTVSYLIKQISCELAQQPASYVKLIQGSIDIIVTILARNNFEVKKTDEKMPDHRFADAMIDYLKDELQQNKTIKVAELLMRFNISEEVANLCVLNKTGMSLRNFIFRYKSDLFKSRVLKVSMSELAQYHP